MASQNVPDPVNRPVDYELIKPVARGARLREIFVLKFSAESSRPLGGVEASSLAQKVRFRVDLVPSASGTLFAAITFGYTAHTSKEQTTPSCDVHGTVMVVFEVNDGEHSLEARRLFAEVNGMYTAWPYIRELVASSAARVGLSSVVLPLWMPGKFLPAYGEFIEMTMQPATEPSR